VEDILTSISTYGYIILFVYSLGGGMVALIAAGILSYKGVLSLEASIAVAALANFIGDAALVYLARFNKNEIMPYIKKHRRKLALAHLLMKRHGDKIIFIKKFIYGVRTIVPFAIGFTRYSMLKFNTISLFAAIIWAVVIGGLSYFAGSSMERAVIYAKDHPYLVPIVLLALVAIVWFYFSKATKKR
jgi:membrane protein DedA with SNARE-associated domain